MYLYLCIFIYVSLFMYLYSCIFIHVSLFMYLYLCIFIYVSLSVIVFVFICKPIFIQANSSNIYASLFVFLYSCIFIYNSIYICIYMYTYIHISMQSRLIPRRFMFHIQVPFLEEEQQRRERPKGGRGKGGWGSHRMKSGALSLKFVDYCSFVARCNRWV